MKELPLALAAFGAYRQFILYKSVPSLTRPGKTDKFPIDYRNARKEDAGDPAIWLNADTAMAMAAAWGEPFGVGFVFTEADPFWFLDIDNCLTPSGWAPHSQQLCRLLSGCAIEVSQSGKGLHLFGCGKPPEHGCRNDSLGIEFYHSDHFVALTGNGAIGTCALNFEAALPSLVATYFPSNGKSTGNSEWSIGPVPEWSGITDDEELIRRALMSRSVASTFGSKASFADLWFADERVLGIAYPDPVRPYDNSSADAALAQHLAFWTGKDCERIRKLMFLSKLARDKWEREDYLPRTITGAVSRQVDVFKASDPLLSPQSLPAGPESPNAPQTGQSSVLDGNRLLARDQQEHLFAGSIYITDSHRALIPGGHLLKPDQFRVHLGGYSFQMDQNNERLSRDPWEAFTQSQLIAWPKVNGACFRPELPEGIIVTRNGQTFVNTYVPVDVPRKQGDPKPFLIHLKKVLPNEQDRLILLSYMAACIQHKGVKFQWAPLLQGVEGNGKTLFTRCVAEAIGRRYVHWPKASKLAKEFNAWMVGKLFFAVEDIYVPEGRREVIEELKPMITGGDGLEIEAKGVDQTSADICGNFMFNSNHRDAVKKTGNDRRFCVLFSAQQEFSDLERDGMDGDYFRNLYDWLRADGYAIVSEYLHTFAIPAMHNPVNGGRAPISSTTDEAISASTGSVEQEILEAVEQGLPGFSGGWISSIFLDKLLERMGLTRKVTHTRRKEMLESLGYHWHPALKEGRVNNPVLPDGGKPRLYIHDSALAKQVTTGAEVNKLYEAANLGRPASFGLPFGARG